MRVYTVYVVKVYVWHIHSASFMIRHVILHARRNSISLTFAGCACRSGGGCLAIHTCGHRRVFKALSTLTAYYVLEAERVRLERKSNTCVKCAHHPCIYNMTIWRREGTKSTGWLKAKCLHLNWTTLSNLEHTCLVHAFVNVSRYFLLKPLDFIL